MKNAAPVGKQESGAKNYLTREQFTAVVRERATGKWHGILRSLGVPVEALRNRHGPCPGCGGVDRFRFDDRDGRGTFVCGGGGDRLAGDGFTLLQHVFGLRFPEAVDAVARDLGLAKGDAAITDEQRRQWQEQARQRREQVDAERERKHRRCAEDAATLWSDAEPAEAHAYLQRKGVQAHGIRQRGGLLLVPMFDAAGALWNVQKISADGSKRFLPGRKSGLFYGIRGRDMMAICEGFATAASLHEATGWHTVCAFDAGNLLPVAEALAGRCPIIIAADNDKTGLSSGQKAADAISARLMVPATPGADWNDAPPDDLRAAVVGLQRRVAA
ncbi:toprim domain-containing protein [Algiphilus sp.]|uniref:toprim domain-containing protein n=1 Tax=Algiphilus sp. TaxID=1872431 RepID=UPI0032EF7101